MKHVRHDDSEIMSISHINVLLVLSCSLALSPSWRWHGQVCTVHIALGSFWVRVFRKRRFFAPNTRLPSPVAGVFGHRNGGFYYTLSRVELTRCDGRKRRFPNTMTSRPGSRSPLLHGGPPINFGILVDFYLFSLQHLHATSFPGPLLPTTSVRPWERGGVITKSAKSSDRRGMGVTTAVGIGMSSLSCGESLSSLPTGTAALRAEFLNVGIIYRLIFLLLESSVATPSSVHTKDSVFLWWRSSCNWHLSRISSRQEVVNHSDTEH